MLMVLSALEFGIQLEQAAVVKYADLTMLAYRAP